MWMDSLKNNAFTDTVGWWRGKSSIDNHIFSRDGQHFSTMGNKNINFMPVGHNIHYENYVLYAQFSEHHNLF